MKRDELKALGLEDEVLDKVMAIHGKDIERHKADLETAEGTVQTLTEQLDEANTTIASFKEMDIEAIKQSAAEYKEKFDTAKQESEQKIAGLKFDHALEKALTNARARNFKSVKALLDLDQLKLDEDGETLEGFEDQIQKVVEENEYLFEIDDEEDPEIITGSNNDNVLGDNVASAAREAAGLST
jgi:hypothetical protein